ncbi:MAG TPA: phosphate ABC transporter permease subunit PstC [Caldisericia bacterium]|nr:phosphate ABC transporter permease subunit PstC [Caldisericia bacterium]
MQKKISIDKVYLNTLYFFGLLIIALTLFIFYELITSSSLSIKTFSWSFLYKNQWNPIKDLYSALPFIIGTLSTSLLAVLISSFLSIGSALFLSEYIKGELASFLASMIDVLAAIPSVVYGLWGLFVLVPVVRNIQGFLFTHLSFIPIFNSKPYGFGIMSAMLILAIMILPYAISMIRSVLEMVPNDLKEAAYALGASKWEVMRSVVLPYVRSGIFAGIGLSLGRALGETMAVTMVIGNRNDIPRTLFDPANTLASVIANEFNEASSSLQLSSLVYLALILFIITFCVNVIMRMILKRYSINKGR